jgi:hypothetical protein
LPEWQPSSSPSAFSSSGDEVEGFFVKTGFVVDDGEGCVSVGGGEPTVGRSVGTLVGGIVVGDPV